jgi:hypothetical protein
MRTTVRRKWFEVCAGASTISFALQSQSSAQQMTMFVGSHDCCKLKRIDVTITQVSVVSCCKMWGLVRAVFVGVEDVGEYFRK